MVLCGIKILLFLNMSKMKINIYFFLIYFSLHLDAQYYLIDEIEKNLLKDSTLSYIIYSELCDNCIRDNSLNFYIFIEKSNKDYILKHILIKEHKNKAKILKCYTIKGIEIKSIFEYIRQHKDSLIYQMKNSDSLLSIYVNDSVYMSPPLTGVLKYIKIYDKSYSSDIMYSVRFYSIDFLEKRLHYCFILESYINYYIVNYYKLVFR